MGTYLQPMPWVQHKIVLMHYVKATKSSATTNVLKILLGRQMSATFMHASPILTHLCDHHDFANNIDFRRAWRLQQKSKTLGCFAIHWIKWMSIMYPESNAIQDRRWQLPQLWSWWYAWVRGGCSCSVRLELIYQKFCVGCATVWLYWQTKHRFQHEACEQLQSVTKPQSSAPLLKFWPYALFTINGPKMCSD